MPEPILLEPGLRGELDLLYARYARTIDGGDAAGWAACFTADGRFVSASGATSTGRAQLEDFARGSYEAWRRDGLAGRHWTANLLVESRSGRGDGLVLRASCYGFVLGVRAGEPPAFLLSSIYADRIVRADGGLRFAERVSTPDAPS